MESLFFCFLLLTGHPKNDHVDESRLFDNISPRELTNYTTCKTLDNDQEKHKAVAGKNGFVEILNLVS